MGEPNKSYACVLASLARYKGTSAVTGCFLELHLTWFKKYHLLSPNYTTISFFVPIKETEALIPAAETLRLSGIKTYQIVRKTQETAQILLQTPRLGALFH